MGYILGLDTGGTFTDAAIIDRASGALVAKAKSPTTRHDLSIGLKGAILGAVDMLEASERLSVDRVCLSTTLATNAVVEGMGGRVGLVMIGFAEAALDRNNLRRVLGNDPVVFVAGGHGSDARAQADLDFAALDSFADKYASDIGALAIVGHFAPRNPEHEIAARDYLHQKTGLPITCGHDLSSSLGGPKRALTAFLNARLIDLLDKQITATSGIMDAANIAGDLMVVKGDGSLVSADFARLRPVETILSGPAASLSGAAHLVGRRDAVVVDIGGTTTDIAILSDGFPRLSDRGAVIGGWQTMVAAADIHTGGLGGDSEARLHDRGVVGGVSLGPRRVIPLAVLAATDSRVMDWMQGQMAAPLPSHTDGRFVMPVFEGTPPSWLTRSEEKMALRCLELGLYPLADLAETRLALGAIDRLVSRSLLVLSAYTPTDAALATGLIESNERYDKSAAMLGGALMARQRTGSGTPQAKDSAAFAEMVLEQLTVQSSLAIMDSALSHQGMGFSAASQNPIIASLIKDKARMVHQGQSGGDTGGLLHTEITLAKPLVALGASAGCYYPSIARVLGAELIVPPDADVAGAIGAAAGSIRQRASIIVTQPSDGIYRAHLDAGPVDFEEMEAALDHAEDAACQAAKAKAVSAGAKDIEVTAQRTLNIVHLSGDKEMFIEATINALASSNPDLKA